MTYGPTTFVLLVMAATLAASCALAGDVERRLRLRVKAARRGLSRRAVRLVALAVLGTALVAAGALGLPGWRTHGSLETGARLLAEGNATAAVRVLVNVLAARPNDARAHYYLGAAYARLGVSPAALTHLKAAVRLAPREAKFHRGLGAAYRRTGDKWSARREFETVVRLEPAEPEHRITLAGALIDEGEIEDAVEHLRRATEMRPGSPESRLLLAMTLKLAGDRDRMLRELREVMRLAPDGALSEIARQEARAAAGWAPPIEGAGPSVTRGRQGEARGYGHTAGGTSR